MCISEIEKGRFDFFAANYTIFFRIELLLSTLSSTWSLHPRGSRKIGSACMWPGPTHVSPALGCGLFVLAWNKAHCVCLFFILPFVFAVARREDIALISPLALYMLPMEA